MFDWVRASDFIFDLNLLLMISPPCFSTELLSTTVLFLRLKHDF